MTISMRRGPPSGLRCSVALICGLGCAYGVHVLVAQLRSATARVVAQG
eukprot:COSAG01_NODE_1576_length_9855_cov_32.477962_5_plen_48_part_00